MGTPLFERGARGVRPTPAGEALLRRARHVIAQLEAAELEIAGLRDRIAGRLAVGAFPTAAATLVPRAMARLRRAHPGLTVTLWEAGSPAQIRRLRAGRMEVAVVATGDGLPDYDLSGLRAEPLELGSGLGVAVSVDHPLVSHDEVDVDDLAAEPWIVGAGGDGEPQFGAWPTLPAPRVVHEARSGQTRLGLVAAGLGISVLPGLAADTVPAGVRWLRVRDPGLVPRRRTVLLTSIDRSAAAAAMISALHDEAAGTRNRSRPRPGGGPGSEAPGRPGDRPRR
jgi:DNA-binding transcriptional LysR family regulator